MDKKNTMLLTVIAVATLLVAVVGATFAYFTATATDSSTNTVVTATTESVATATLASDVTALKATLSAADFAQGATADDSVYQSYWATTSTTDPYDTAEELRTILTASVGADATASTNYTCTAKLNVTVEGATLQEGDAYIKFGGQLSSVGEVDLSKVSADGYTITFNLDGATNKEQVVTAAVRFVNRHANQDHLAGKTITVTLETDDTEANKFSCTVVNQ